MSPDRELLEMAAKAAGIIGGCYAATFGGIDNFSAEGIYMGHRHYWNPLTYNSEALWLAVRLHMGIQSNGPDHWQSPSCTIVLFDGPVCGHRLTQQHDGDPEAATRRAITRAAAEIGRNMP